MWKRIDDCIRRGELGYLRAFLDFAPGDPRFASDGSWGLLVAHVQSALGRADVSSSLLRDAAETYGTIVQKWPAHTSTLVSRARALVEAAIIDDNIDLEAVTALKDAQASSFLTPDERVELADAFLAAAEFESYRSEFAIAARDLLKSVAATSPKAWETSLRAAGSLLAVAQKMEGEDAREVFSISGDFALLTWQYRGTDPIRMQQAFRLLASRAEARPSAESYATVFQAAEGLEKGGLLGDSDWLHVAAIGQRLAEEYEPGVLRAAQDERASDDGEEDEAPSHDSDEEDPTPKEVSDDAVTRKQQLDRARTAAWFVSAGMRAVGHVAQRSMERERIEGALLRHERDLAVVIAKRATRWVGGMIREASAKGDVNGLRAAVVALDESGLGEGSPVRTRLAGRAEYLAAKSRTDDAAALLAIETLGAAARSPARDDALDELLRTLLDAALWLRDARALDDTVERVLGTVSVPAIAKGKALAAVATTYLRSAGNGASARTAGRALELARAAYEAARDHEASTAYANALAATALDADADELLRSFAELELYSRTERRTVALSYAVGRLSARVAQRLSSSRHQEQALDMLWAACQRSQDPAHLLEFAQVAVDGAHLFASEDAADVCIARCIVAETTKGAATVGGLTGRVLAAWADAHEPETSVALLTRAWARHKITGKDSLMAMGEALLSRANGKDPRALEVATHVFARAVIADPDVPTSLRAFVRALRASRPGIE